MKLAIAERSRWRFRFAHLSVLLAAAAFPAFAAEDGKRIAFLIGNDTYLQNSLKNSVNDARLMERALKSAGFQTILLENARKDEIEDKLGELADRVGPDDTVLFFYAGHAFQIESENYLVPVDFTPPKGIAQARSKCFSLSTLFQELKRARARRTIVILDACRSNPFASVYSLASGLAEPQNAGKETLIAFSTSPNHVAGDNPEGRNSLFTEALADLIEQPNETASITDIFARVIKRVQSYSGDRQTPWFTTNFSSKFYYRTPSNEVAESDASLTDKWMSEAALRERRGDFERAIQLVEQVLKKQPGGATAAAAQSKLSFLTARNEARNRDDKLEFAAAAELYEKAFAMDPFSFDSALHGVNNYLLTEKVPEALRLLQAIRVRGSSESAERANLMLMELAAVFPEARRELQAGIPAPPPIQEVFAGIRFGAPDWGASQRYMEANPVSLGRWVVDLIASKAPVLVIPGSPPASPAAPAVASSVVKPAVVAPDSDTPAPMDALRLEFVAKGDGTRELDYGDSSPGSAAPRRPISSSKPSAPATAKAREFGYVVLDGPVADTTVLVNGNPFQQKDPGKLQLPVGQYEVRVVKEGKVLSRQDVVVKALGVVTVTVKRN
jgi:hypothetical protein